MLPPHTLRLERVAMLPCWHHADPALGCRIKTDVQRRGLFLFIVFVFGGLFVFVFWFLGFWFFFKAFHDLMPEISCARIKSFDGSKEARQVERDLKGAYVGSWSEKQRGDVKRSQIALLENGKFTQEVPSIIALSSSGNSPESAHLLAHTCMSTVNMAC